MSFRLTMRVVYLLAVLLSASCSSPAPASGTPATTATLEPTPTSEELPTLTPVRTPAAAGLYVDAASEQGSISPLVYGTNYGPWLFVPLQRQQDAIDAQLTIVRYPGGNWGDQNDLDEWQIDQYIAFCRQIGAEPYIHVRLKDSTAEKAAELVRLVNIQKQYAVKYWTIGNEPNLYGEGYETEQFNREWREWAEAMRAVDQTIMLIGPEVNQFVANPTDDYSKTLERWVVEFLKANGDMVDIVSFHRYPFPTSRMSGSPEPEELMATTREWDDLIPAMRSLAREHTGRDLPVAVTEVNSSWSATVGTDTSMDSHLNAIWWGDSLGRMIRQGTYMVTQFAIIGDYGLMKNYDLNPIYYVYKMYQQFGATLIYAASDDPEVSIFAARREDGALTLMIVNMAFAAKEQTLTVEGATGEPSEAWLFDEEHLAVDIDAASVIDGNTLSLPASSMTLLVIK